MEDLKSKTPKLPMQGGGVGDGVQESGLKTQIGLVPFPPKAAKASYHRCIQSKFSPFFSCGSDFYWSILQFSENRKILKNPDFLKIFHFFFSKMPFFLKKILKILNFLNFLNFSKFSKNCFWLQKGAFFENFEKNYFSQNSQFSHFSPIFSIFSIFEEKWSLWGLEGGKKSRILRIWPTSPV